MQENVPANEADLIKRLRSCEWSKGPVTARQTGD